MVADGAVRVFRGLPYAAPPVGNLRWRPPQPPGCYVGEFDATAFGPECPQLEASPDGPRPLGEEDCLYLNVWGPLGERALVPVLVFIHGGGNVQGSATVRFGTELLYDGRALASEQRVVIITLNYRLGALGWLTHPALDREDARPDSGNYGLLDQIRALEWIRDNVAAFGGDPERVMVFGESAGAVNTCALVASPQAAGLFSSALMQSGGCQVATREQVRAASDELVAATDCAGATDIAACLRSRSPERLLEDYPPTISVAGPSGDLRPHVDGALLQDQPRRVIESGRHNHVPFVIGANADETSRDVPQLDSDEAYEELVRSTYGPLAAGILARYPVADFPSPRAAYVAVTTDSRFVCTSRRDARSAASGQTAPVHRYFFTQGLEASPALSPLGAWHGLELFFVFQRLRVGGYQPTEEEIELAQTMGGYWSRLAETGNPAMLPGAPWPIYDAESDRTLVMEGASIGVVEGIRTARCDFWDLFSP